MAGQLTLAVTRAGVEALQGMGLPLPDAPPAKRDLYGNEVKKQYSGGLQRIIRTIWASGLEPSPAREAEAEKFARAIGQRMLEKQKAAQAKESHER